VEDVVHLGERVENLRPELAVGVCNDAESHSSEPPQRCDSVMSSPR
jgi:hypothetical protein